MNETKDAMTDPEKSPRYDEHARQVYTGTLGSARDRLRQDIIAESVLACFRNEDEKPLKAGEAEALVLDVGCGQGTQAIKLAQNGHRVIGVDVNVAMLEHFQEAKAKTSPEVQQRLGMVIGDGMNLPTPENTFDAVLCHGVLAYLNDKEQRMILRSLRRAVKCGSDITSDPRRDGIVSILTVNGDAAAQQAAMAGDWEEAAKLTTADEKSIITRKGVELRAFWGDALPALLRECGLQEVRRQGIRVVTDHQSEEVLDSNFPTIKIEETRLGYSQPSSAAFIHTICKPIRVPETPTLMSHHSGADEYLP